MLTLNNGKQYIFDVLNIKISECQGNSFIKMIWTPYVLGYNGHLYKRDVMIAKNIKDMSHVYNDNFFCDNDDGILMLYKNSKFYKFEHIDCYSINQSYIDIIVDYHIYRFSCERWLNIINEDNMLELVGSIRNGTCEKIKPHKILKIMKTDDIDTFPYLLLDNGCVTFCEFYWNMISIGCDTNEIIDIYSYAPINFNNYIIILINKNSTINYFKVNDIETWKEELILEQTIVLDGQLIKYNGKNIFKIENVHDVLENIKYLNKNTKIQINILLCVLKRYIIIMPKPLKLLIISKLLII